jgi:MoaA/NifB/PqqE/SkfB family radical SAM enzyme
MGYLCSNPWTTAFVWGDGRVTHCCYSNIGAVGNIRNQTLAEIWRGKKIDKVRKRILKGKFPEAGCEYFCRVFRWNRYYGGLRDMPAIPEGLGRLEDYAPDSPGEFPPIIGIALDARCNLRCTHCLSSNDAPGLSGDDIERIWEGIARAKIVRLVNGEFSINPKALEILGRIAELPSPPRVFLNTNGTVEPDKYLAIVDSIPSFHLKFSLEGLGEDYERVRTGAEWEIFEKHLMQAKGVFDAKEKEGKDWKLFLNFCVMRSNFDKIPVILAYAVRHGCRLVLNTVNGMRHIDENMFMYEHVVPPAETIAAVRTECLRILDSADYIFRDEFLGHLDYILRVLGDKKLRVNVLSVKRMMLKRKGRTADRILYLRYLWRFDKKSFFRYAFRKIKKIVFKG